MRGKLGFGFITALRPEILLIDDLGVGDAEFRVKAQNRLKSSLRFRDGGHFKTFSGISKGALQQRNLLDSGKSVFYGQ